jgi:hypothetical protein
MFVLKLYVSASPIYSALITNVHHLRHLTKVCPRRVLCVFLMRRKYFSVQHVFIMNYIIIIIIIIIIMCLRG